MARPRTTGPGPDLAKEEYWRDTLERWRSTGKTQAEFCRQEHLNENTFSSWKKVIQKRDLGKPRKAAAVVVEKSEQHRPGFVRLEIAESQECAGAIEGAPSASAQKHHCDQVLAAEIIDLAKGTRLRIYNGADHSTFAALLSTFARS